ncbi:MAG: alpha-L-fucosidase [Prolixibacteraceae bacterium]
MKKLAVILVLVLSVVSTFGQNKQKMEEWKDARFGMFIHWGPVSLKGTEIGWSRGREIPVDEYDNLYKQFNPANFDANAWVSVAKAAGMKYIVLTTKHHDGFCLWNTRQTDYNIMNSPLHRDVVKELAEACKKQGIAFGTYYSTTDWHHPDFPLTSPGGTITRPKSDLEAYTTYLKKQVAELLLNYGPLYVLWFDVPQKFDAVRGQSVIDFARTIQPDIIINNRTGAKGDFDTPEQRVGGFQVDRPWESCITIANQWAWKPNDPIKSLEQCLHTLIRTAGGDGNLLFNVGPMPDGRIEPAQVDKLKEMGQWMQKYGSTIYETRGGPFKPTDWGVSTRKGNKIFLHILKWSGKTIQITLPDIGMEIKNCRLLDGGKIKVTKKEGNTILEFGQEGLQPINTIVEIEAAGNVMGLKPMEIRANSLSFMKPVKASSGMVARWSNHQYVDPKSVTNGDWSGAFWEAEEKDQKPWVEIDLVKPEKIVQAVIYERGNSVKSFELQALSGEAWKTIYKGKTIGAKAELKLSKVTTSRVRLVINEFSGLPGIYEIVLM